MREIIWHVHTDEEVERILASREEKIQRDLKADITKLAERDRLK